MKKLKLKIKENPELGDKLFVRTSYSVTDCSGDVQGGLASISEIKPVAGSNPKRWLVKFKTIPNHEYDWESLMRLQQDLREEYKGKEAKELLMPASTGTHTILQSIRA